MHGVIVQYFGISGETVLKRSRSMMPLNVCKAKATKDLVVAGSGLFRRIERCQIQRNYVMNNFSRCPIVLGHRWMATKRQIREQEKLKVKMSSSDVEMKSINGDDDFEERLLKASTMAKSNVEIGISIDKSGLYQPHMHNNLPDFNDPNLTELFYLDFPTNFDGESNIKAIESIQREAKQSIKSTS